MYASYSLLAVMLTGIVHYAIHKALEPSAQNYITFSIYLVFKDIHNIIHECTAVKINVVRFLHLVR